MEGLSISRLPAAITLSVQIINIRMKQRLFQVKAFYKSAPQSAVTFTVSATTRQMVKTFVHAYVPQLVVVSVEHTDTPDTQHYSFADVNPVISAQLHLTNKRRTGSATHRKHSVLSI